MFKNTCVVMRFTNIFVQIYKQSMIRTTLRFFFFAAAISTPFQYGCKNENKTTKTETVQQPEAQSGGRFDQPTKSFSKPSYEFTHHIKNEGEKPTNYKYCYCNLTMTNNENVIVSTYKTGKPHIEVLTESDEGNGASPLTAALRQMAVGDSMTVVVNEKDVQERFGKMGLTGKITYQIKLLAVKTSQEHFAEANKAINSSKSKSTKSKK